MRINQTKKVEVEAKTLKLYMKVCDGFSATVTDQDGAELAEYEGYVPGFFPGDHFGDYLILDIDIDSGQIVNWKPPTAAEIERLIADSRDDD